MHMPVCMGVHTYVCSQKHTCLVLLIFNGKVNVGCWPTQLTDILPRLLRNTFLGLNTHESLFFLKKVYILKKEEFIMR